MVEEINKGKFTVEEDTIREDSRSGIFQFNGCQYVAVYIKSGNTSGNKIKNSGHIVPQVIRMSCFLFSCKFGAHSDQIMVEPLLSPVTIGCPLI